MSSRKIIYFLFFILFIFVANITLFYWSSDYRGFLQSIKLGNGEENDLNVSDEYTYSPKPEDVIYMNEDTGSIIPSTGTWKEGEKTQSWSLKKAVEIVMTSEDDNILKKFLSFQLKRIFIHPSLFDLTTEYPDEYFEYSNGSVSLYFFVTKTYDGVFDIFDVLSNELPFSINQTNSFWERSFYVNLDKDFVDDNIRIIIEYKKRVFWLKIKKDTYNQVKEILAYLKKL
jgi:hypothetical protein